MSSTLAATAALAGVTASSSRIVGSRYSLEAMGTGEPCDRFEWNVLAGAGAMIDGADQQVAEAKIGTGLYIFEVTCFRGEGEDETRETSTVAIDTRPPALIDLGDFDFGLLWDPQWEFPPLCITCGSWLEPLDESQFDIWTEGTPQENFTMVDFAELANEWGLDPTPTPMMPADVELNYGGLETFTTLQGQEELGAGMTLVGYTEDSSDQLTVGALNIGNTGLVAGAFVIEAWGE